MNTQEKQAWFILVVIAASLAAYAILYVITRSYIVSTASFALMGLIGATSLIGRNERRSGRVVADERDHQINRTAVGFAYSIFWVLLVAAVMSPFFILGPDATLCIKTATLTTILYPAMCFILAMRSAVIIVLYRKGRHA